MNSEQRWEAIEQRVRALEDQLEIHHLMVRYGLALDSGDVERAGDLFTKDGVYDIDVMVMNGREEIEAMVRGEGHQSLLPNCAHTVGPVDVQVQGDVATATGYSRVYLKRDEENLLWRLSYNRFQLRREADGRWRIARRVTRLVGHEESQDILRRAWETPTA